MSERKEPSDFDGGKFPANGRPASKGLALAEFIDSAVTGSPDGAVNADALDARELSPFTEDQPKPRFAQLMRGYPLVMTAAATAIGFVAGIAATFALSSRR